MPSNTTLSALLALVTFGCASTPEPLPPPTDPALVAFHALPMAGGESASQFADELEAFEWARQAYVLRGWPDAGGIPLELDTNAVIPYATEGKVVSPPFLGPAETMREHLAAVSTLFYRGELDDYAESFATPTEAREAYEAFMLAMLLHELAHAVAQVREVAEDDAYFEEMRAIDFEVTILADLVTAGQLAPWWLERYEAFNRVLLGAAPSGLVDELPTDDVKRALAFNRHYALMNKQRAETIATGRNTAQDSTDRVLAMYTQHRLLRVKAPPTMKDIAASLEPPDLDVHFETVLTDSLVAFERTGPMFRFAAGPAVYTVRFNRRNVFFRGMFGLTVPAERRAAVFEFANLVLGEQTWGRFEVDADGALVFAFMGVEMSNFNAVSRIRRGTEVVDRWRTRFAAVIGGEEPQAVHDAYRAEKKAEVDAAQRRLEEVQ